MQNAAVRTGGLAATTRLAVPPPAQQAVQPPTASSRSADVQQRAHATAAATLSSAISCSGCICVAARRRSCSHALTPALPTQKRSAKSMTAHRVRSQMQHGRGGGPRSAPQPHSEAPAVLLRSAASAALGRPGAESGSYAPQRQKRARGAPGRRRSGLTRATVQDTRMCARAAGVRPQSRAAPAGRAHVWRASPALRCACCRHHLQAASVKAELVCN